MVLNTDAKQVEEIKATLEEAGVDYAHVSYQQGRAAESPFFFGGVMVLRRGPSGPHAVSLFYFSMVSDYKVALQCCYVFTTVTGACFSHSQIRGLARSFVRAKKIATHTREDEAQNFSTINHHITHKTPPP